MFAASRNESVAGRTTVLMVSASVRKGFNQEGAPSGRSAAINEEMFCFADLIIRASHKGRPKVRVNNRCLDEGSTYGISPVQLVIIINRNRGEIIDVIPLIDLPSVRDIWSFIKDIGIASACEARVGEIQKKDIVTIMGIILASHIRKIEVDLVWDRVSIINGSKDEKRSVIIRRGKECAGFETLRVSF